MDPEAKALKEEPVLSYVESYYMKVFSDLNRSRQSSMGVGSIPLSEIRAYCDMFGVNDYGERSDMLFVIGEMDDELISFYNKKNSTKK